MTVRRLGRKRLRRCGRTLFAAASSVGSAIGPVKHGLSGGYGVDESVDMNCGKSFSIMLMVLVR